MGQVNIFIDLCDFQNKVKFPICRQYMQFIVYARRIVLFEKNIAMKRRIQLVFTIIYTRAK